MRNIVPLFGIALVVLMVSAVSADTIYLKNGSVIKGKVGSFSDDQFVVTLNTGSERFSSRAQIYVGDVARIEFEANSGAAPDSATAQPVPASTAAQPQPADTSSSQQPVTSPSVPNGMASGSGAAAPASSGTGAAGTDATATPPASQPPDNSGSQPVQPPATTAPATDQTAAQPPADAAPAGDATPPTPRKGVKTANVDVLAKRDWTSTGLIVKRGDHIRITASGQVTLDPNSGDTSGPDGIDKADAKKLMPDRPTGALIAVLGADNDDFIFVGHSVEFTATRSGLLFLSVNEGNLSDNLGSYKAAIEVEPGNADQ